MIYQRHSMAAPITTGVSMEHRVFGRGSDARLAGWPTYDNPESALLPASRIPIHAEPKQMYLFPAAPVSDGGAEELDAGTEPEDALDLLFKSPYPYFGGKSRAARLVWRRFGDVRAAIEPFFGSGAFLLNRPLPFQGVETVNDLDGFIANFWRAVKADPEAVADHADWPVNENDLHARHAWLLAQKETMQTRLEGDAEYFDAKVAGWWVWGMSCWIGAGFCSGNGPWRVIVAEDGSRQLVHLSDAGQGVNRQRVHLSDAGRGVNRKRVHLSNAGRGVNRQLVHLSDAGRGVNRQLVHLSDAGRGAKPGLGECGLLAWIKALSQRMERVRVCCGDWTRVCGGHTGDALTHFFGAGQPCGVFLDPPYADTADRHGTLYRVDSDSIAHKVREWAIAHGGDERLRIALCGYDGEHEMPADWSCVSWKAPGGYAKLGNGRGKRNCARERIWFSKFCLRT
jgi:hypothetical protein